MSTGPDTLLVDGTDLRSLAYLRITNINLFAPGTRRGEDDVIPGRRGQFGVAGLPLDAYPFTVQGNVTGTTRGNRNANLFDLVGKVGGSNGDGLIALTRHLANSTDTGTVDYTAAGRFVGLSSVALLNPTTAQIELQFTNLSGAWKRTSDGVWIIP